jgi:choline transport protein
MSQVTTTTHIPRNSVFVTFIIIALLSLIPLGSVIAFNIITSLSSIAIFSSYWISIACRVANRFSSKPIEQPRWNMGAAGVFVNVFALIFLSLGIVMICFPSAPNPTPASFNWTVVIWGGVTIFALVYYFVYGKRHYASPRSRITQFGQESDMDMQEFEQDQKAGEVSIMADDRA